VFVSLHNLVNKTPRLKLTIIKQPRMIIEPKRFPVNRDPFRK
jgi:hypothetical protein